MIVLGDDIYAPMIVLGDDIYAPMIVLGDDIYAPMIVLGDDIYAPIIVLGDDIYVPMIVLGDDIYAPSFRMTLCPLPPFYVQFGMQQNNSFFLSESKDINYPSSLYRCVVHAHQTSPQCICVCMCVCMCVSVFILYNKRVVCFGLH